VEFCAKMLEILKNAFAGSAQVLALFSMVVLLLDFFYSLHHFDVPSFDGAPILLLFQS